MKRFGILLLLLGLILPAACASREGLEGRQAGPAPVPQAAGPEAGQALRRGMSPREVKAILGEPDDVIIYSGEGAPERWKYFHSPYCLPGLGAGTPCTELVFVKGRLREWRADRNPRGKGLKGR